MVLMSPRCQLLGYFFYSFSAIENSDNELRPQSYSLDKSILLSLYTIGLKYFKLKLLQRLK